METNITKSLRENSNKIVLDLIALLLVILTIFIPRIMELGQFVTPDEHLWLTRSANFYYALGQRDFAATNQIYHPGVTTMWIGTAGFLSRYPEYRGSGMGQIDSDTLHNYINTIPDLEPIDLLLAAKYLMVIAHTVILGISYLYTRKLIGLEAAFTAFILIAFFPFHIGLSRVLQLDAMVSNLLLLSLLAFIYYLYKRNFRELAVSAIAAGLSLLTKSPAFLLIPVILVLLRIDTIKKISTSINRSIKFQIRLLDYPLLFWVVICIIVIIIFWPAMWVKPFQTISDVLSWIGEAAGGGHEWPVFFNGQIIEDGNLGLKYFYFYPVTFLFRSTPVVLIGLLIAIPGFLKKWEPFNEARVNLTLLGLCIFIAIFTIGLTLVGKKFDRYFLPVYMPLTILSTIGWVSLTNWLQKKFPEWLPNYRKYFILAVIIIFQLAGVFQTYPYYFTYYNPIVGGSKKAPDIMLIGWGEGLDQAARYLNEKENAEELKAISWYARGPFSYFFNGESRDLHPATSPDNKYWNLFLSSDYAVIYVHQWQRGFPKPVVEYIENLTPEHSIWIDGIEYVRIFRIR